MGWSVISHIDEKHILYARKLLEEMDEKTAMDALVAGGCRPGLAFLAVKAAGLLREPYVLKEQESRIVDSSKL